VLEIACFPLWPFPWQEEASKIGEVSFKGKEMKILLKEKDKEKTWKEKKSKQKNIPRLCLTRL
jgi:hypothetical protein